MAFTKKAKPADAVEEPEEEDEEAIPTAVEGAAPGATAEAADGGDAEMMASLAVVEPDPPAEGGGDALLDMFTTVGVEVVDRSVLTNLAGEVEITDLISELNVVAAALGIVISERTHHEEPVEEEQLAA